VELNGYCRLHHTINYLYQNGGKFLCV
jgi:hypothetical protein